MGPSCSSRCPRFCRDDEKPPAQKVGNMPLTSRRRIVFPDSEKLKARRKSLPRFKSLELDELAKHPGEHDDTEDHFARLTRILRRETNHQMLELLRRLGVDAAQSDAWRKGFFWL